MYRAFHFSAVEVVNAIKASKDVQALCLEGNTIGVGAAEAIGEALSTRQEFEVKANDRSCTVSPK